MYNNGVGDHRAVYQDGMWAAVDYDAAEGYYDEEWYEDEEDMYPQDAYYLSLLARYQALRNTLATADPQELAVLVKADPKKYANVRLPYYKSDWRYAFDNKYPTPALVAQIDDKTLYRAMEYLAEVLTINDTISKQKSTWIWTLLALVGERGTLDFYREGRIRELGHKAGQLSIRLRSSERQRHKDFEEHEEQGAEEWEVEGEGTDGQDDDDEGESEAGQECDVQVGVTAPDSSHQTDADGVEDGEVEDDESPTHIGAQLDGSDSKPADPTVSADQTNEDNAMSTSTDEGEIQDEDEPADLEAARARLLAQLGDNLVKDSIPDEKLPDQQFKGTRHRHNGKVCRDSSCRMHNKARLEAHRRAGVRAAQGGKKDVVEARSSANNGRERETSTHGTASHQASPSNHNGDVPSTEDASKQLSRDGVSVSPAQEDGATDSSHSNTQNSPVRAAEPNDKADIQVNTRVTIDMILTVVGECYGQRDLLQYRETW